MDKRISLLDIHSYGNSRSIGIIRCGLRNACEECKHHENDALVDDVGLDDDVRLVKNEGLDGNTLSG